MRRQIKAALAMATACIAASFMFATPAFADGDDSACFSGDFCIWRDIHYITDGSSVIFFAQPHYVRVLGNFNYGYYNNGNSYSAGDSASSTFNNGLYLERANYYAGQNCDNDSHSFGLDSGQDDSDFTNGSPVNSSGYDQFNDIISSIAFQSYVTTCRT